MYNNTFRFIVRRLVLTTCFLAPFVILCSSPASDYVYEQPERIDYGIPNIYDQIPALEGNVAYDWKEDYLFHDTIPNAYESVSPVSQELLPVQAQNSASRMPNRIEVIDESNLRPVSVPGALEGMVYWCDLPEDAQGIPGLSPLGS